MTRGNHQAHVVVVDDDARVCRLIERLAKSLGATIDSITEVHTSTDLHKLADADLVLLDLGMPNLDGVEVLRRLAGLGCTARISLISGTGPGVLESASRLGFELDLEMGAPIGKPLDVDELQDLIRGVIRSRSRSSVPSSDSLAEALDLGEVVPHYQPKVDLDSGAMQGIEVLARWHSPTFGDVAPNVFIPIAEEAGLMDRLTRSIAVDAFAGLRCISSLAPGLNLSLNLSPSQLTDLSYPDKMQGWACEAGIDPTRVTIEITESEAMRDPTRYMDILIRFRLKGFHLSVDDFGTGFSSLDHLYQLPFEELKIDRTFVRDLGRREGATVIVKAMIALAKGLGMSTVAEGIEDRETARLLTEYGCNQGQGYFFSKALSLGELRELLEQTAGQVAKTGHDAQGEHRDRTVEISPRIVTTSRKERA